MVAYDGANNTCLSILSNYGEQHGKMNHQQTFVFAVKYLTCLYTNSN